jgi:hypothetical protein
MIYVGSSMKVPEFVDPTTAMASRQVFELYAGSELHIQLAAKPSNSSPTDT